MTRVATSNYGAEATTQFAWATTDQDLFDRELDLYHMSQAVEKHDHSAGRGLAVARLATDAVTTASILALNVTEAKLAAGAVTETKLGTGAVTNTKLGAASVDHTKIATLTGSVLFAQSIGLKIGLYGSTAGIAIAGGIATLYPNTGIIWGVSADAAGTGFGALWHSANDGPSSGLNADLLDNSEGAAYLARANHTGTQAPATISPQGTGSGLDADTVDGMHAAAIVAAGVPIGAVVWFRTTAELTAAGASWTTETSLSGRIPYGTGTTFGVPFTANTDVGANWTPLTGVVTSIANQALALAGQTSGANTNVQANTHDHTIPATQWVPPGRVGVFGRRI